MNQKEYELLAGVIHRTAAVGRMERNAIKRQAKSDALRLLVSDLTGTLKHTYPKTFDEAKFLRMTGV